MKKNQKNMSYQACYKRKGFNKKVFWSSTVTDNSGVAFIYFEVGGLFEASSIDAKYINTPYVSCVK